eukprot:UN10789
MKSFIILLLICTIIICTLANNTSANRLLLNTRQQYEILQDVVIPPVNVTSYFDPAHPGVVHFQIMINTMEYETPGTSLKISLGAQPPQQQVQQQQYNINAENPFKLKVHNVTCP